MTENALFLLPALRRARDLIDRDYAEPLDLHAMAAEAGYSRFTSPGRSWPRMAKLHART